MHWVEIPQKLRLVVIPRGLWHPSCVMGFFIFRKRPPRSLLTILALRHVPRAAKFNLTFFLDSTAIARRCRLQKCAHIHRVKEGRPWCHSTWKKRPSPDGRQNGECKNIRCRLKMRVHGIWSNVASVWPTHIPPHAELMDGACCLHTNLSIMNTRVRYQ